ncbi:MAG: hypothetical protein ABSF00_07280 [Candidatus Bathyarchaeia archaeon]
MPSSYTPSYTPSYAPSYTPSYTPSYAPSPAPSTYNVQADLGQQSLSLLSRLWPSLSTQERANTISLLLYAVQGYPSAVQGLRGWFADRSRYDTRTYA